jgi:hypothetical protein
MRVRARWVGGGAGGRGSLGAPKACRCEPTQAEPCNTSSPRCSSSRRYSRPLAPLMVLLPPTMEMAATLRREVGGLDQAVSHLSLDRAPAHRPSSHSPLPHPEGKDDAEDRRSWDQEQGNNRVDRHGWLTAATLPVGRRGAGGRDALWAERNGEACRMRTAYGKGGPHFSTDIKSRFGR